MCDVDFAQEICVDEGGDEWCGHWGGCWPSMSHVDGADEIRVHDCR